MWPIMENLLTRICSKPGALMVGMKVRACRP
jgi:hypothetical protein